MNRRTSRAYDIIRARGMDKTAGFGDVIAGLTMIGRSGGEMLSYKNLMMSAGLIALASGGAILAAKATAKDKRSEGTYKKTFNNAQLEANIRELKAKLRYEAYDKLHPEEADDVQEKQKAMRLL